MANRGAYNRRHRGDWQPSDRHRQGLDLLSQAEHDAVVVLRDIRLISDLDKAAFASYCVAWARWVEAEEALKNYGIVLKAEKGLVRSSYLAIAAQALDQMKSLISDFGMTPASRSRVQAAALEDEDPIEAFIMQKPGGSR